MIMSQSALPMLGARRDQMFPTMTQADIDRLRRFGESNWQIDLMRSTTRQSRKDRFWSQAAVALNRNSQDDRRLDGSIRQNWSIWSVCALWCAGGLSLNAGRAVIVGSRASIGFGSGTGDHNQR